MRLILGLSILVFAKLRVTQEFGSYDAAGSRYRLHRSDPTESIYELTSMNLLRNNLQYRDH